MSQQNRQPQRQGGRGRGMMAGDKAKDFSGSIRKLLRYLKPFAVRLIIIILIASASTVFSIIGPKILGSATTTLAQGLVAKYTGTGSIDFSRIFSILRTLGTIYVISMIFSYIQGWLMASVTQRLTYTLRKEISEKINRLPLSYFDKQTHGDVLSRITNDVDTVSQTLNQSIQQIFTSVITVIGVLYMMLRISWQLTIMALVVVPLSGIAAAFVVKNSQPYFKAQQKTLGNVNGHIEEMYGGHIVMKAFNGEERSINEFNDLNNKLYEAGWKAQFMSGLMQPITNLIGNIGYVGCCVLGGYLSIHNGLAIGDIQAFIQYVRSFNQPITQTAKKRPTRKTRYRSAMKTAR